MAADGLPEPAKRPTVRFVRHEDAPVPGEVMFRSAVAAARGLDAKRLFVFSESLPDLSVLARVDTGALSLVLVVHGRQAERAAAGPLFEVLSIPEVDLSRRAQLRTAMLLAASEGMLERGETFVCLAAEAGRVADTLVALRVDEDSAMHGCALPGVPAAGRIRRAVFARVLDLCLQLGAEGREGKPVGTSFIVGDVGNVRRHTQQLIINPFRGYNESHRNLLDPKLKETVKGFSTLDGAFIVKGNGVCVSAGTYLTGLPRLGDPELAGLGTRHHSAAAMTSVTSAVAFVISESTGTVRVFRRGALIAEIERASAVRPRRSDSASTEIRSPARG